MLQRPKFHIVEWDERLSRLTRRIWNDSENHTTRLEKLRKIAKP